MFTSGSTPFGIFDSDADFVADADRMVTFVRQKLGSPVLLTHLSSSQIYACFEEAALEFSAITNQYQAKSVLTQFLGGPTGSLQGSEQKYPARLLEFQKKMAEPYGEEIGLNGPHPLFSASIDLQVGQQDYDLQALLSGILPDLTASAGGSSTRIRMKDLFHFSPLAAFRFFGTTSAVNFLNNQFNFESFTPETIFYLLPIWEDVLRGMQFKLSQKVRRSNFSFAMHNNVLKIYPVPSQNVRLHFTFTLPPDPTQEAPGEHTRDGVSNLSNVPFGVIQYSHVNSIGKQWIRRLTLAFSKEVEGLIRSKYSTIPIPNGDVTLNGPELISDARNDIEVLRTELRDILDELTYEKLAQREQALMEATEATLMRVPLGIFIG